MQHVNLLDLSLLPPASRLPAHRLLGLLLLGVVAVAAHGALERYRFANTLATASATPAAQAAEPAASGAAHAELQRKVEQTRQLVDVLQGGQALTRDPAATLGQVLRVLPDTLWLTELELQGERGLRIAGGTLDPAALAVFAERLSQSASLRGRAVETLRLEHEPPTEGEAAAPSRHRFVLGSVPEGEAVASAGGAR